jgi:hypothetical protein
LQTLAHANELLLNEQLIKSGKISYRVKESPEAMKELRALKGLMEEDRKRVLLYNK